MDLKTKAQYTSLTLTLFVMSYIIYGWVLIAYVWLIAGFLLWLTGGTRHNVLKVSLFWLLALWVEPISKWMLDSDLD